MKKIWGTWMRWCEQQMTGYWLLLGGSWLAATVASAVLRGVSAALVPLMLAALGSFAVAAFSMKRRS